jgi:hypothetical protein
MSSATRFWPSRNWAVRALWTAWFEALAPARKGSGKCRSAPAFTSSWVAAGTASRAIRGHLIDRRSVDDLTREIVAEIHDGVVGTGIGPGIIGEVGTDKSWVSAQEERACIAPPRELQLVTGMVLTSRFD